MIKNYMELDDMHIDVLRELGNIGAGNAATSLSVLLNESVTIEVPQVKILDYNSAVRTVGDPEERGIAIMLHYSGDVAGIVLFVLAYEDAHDIAEILAESLGEGWGEAEGISEIKISAIKEIGNILGSSYLGSIATLTGLGFDISVPHVSIDMIGAIMSAPLVEFSIDNNMILLIEESFVTDRRSLKSHVIMFADIPSLNKILSKLGIEV